MDLYLVNGFLGSGKTTAIAHACKQLIQQNIKAAVITNDQGKQQVDSAYLQSLSLPTGEVGDGCFCCRYSELESTLDALRSAVRPEIIFAEAVGSCTDLNATVIKPFVLLHRDVRIVLSVFADAYLLHAIMKGTASFIGESVQYIYKKQLEEADLIVLSKIDLLSADELSYVNEMIERTYPGKKTFCLNAYDENNIADWIRLLSRFEIPAHRNSLALDYDLYGAGEAMLAWFDQKISVHTHEPIAVKASIVLIDKIHHKIRCAGYTTGHLKFLLSGEGWVQKISYTTNGIGENPEAGSHACKHVDILINARVQTSPYHLKEMIESSIEETMTQTGCRIVSHKPSAFEPGYPNPLHRIIA